MQPMYTRGFIRCRARVIPSVAVVDIRQVNKIRSIKQKRAKNVLLKSNNHKWSKEHIGWEVLWLLNW